MLDLPLEPIKGQGEAQSLGAVILVPVGGWGKRIVPMLDYVRRKPLCESLRCRVEVVQNCVAAPPTYKADCVCVDARHEEVHGAAGPHQARTDVIWCEPHLRSDDCGCSTECCGDFCAAYCGPPLKNVARCVSGGGAVLL